MRSPYEDFASSAATTHNEDTDNQIPYHARENSQPFSYGQIGYKTSTPIRNNRATLSTTTTTTTNGQYRGGGESWGDTYDTITNTKKYLIDLNNYNLNDYKTTPRRNNYGNNNNTEGLQTGSESKMIKAQPRLTSPLLVRKTLNRSPTRNTAAAAASNTIANTYHYSYNNNGDNNNYEYNNKYNTNTYTNNNSSSSAAGGASLRRTPARNDFEELLRERREKVYNEYQRSASVPTKQRQQQQQLSSVTAAPNGQNKYNFDFEFNLNLDDIEVPPPPRRSNTMEQRSRSSLQYRTYDIPVATSVERNYHTISSSTNAKRETYGGYGRPPLNDMRTAATYDRYGNENASGYGGGGGRLGGGGGGVAFDGVDVVDGTATLRSTANMFPIYATTTKQQRNQQQPQQQQQQMTTTTTRSYHDITKRSTNEPELAITDYALISPSASNTTPQVVRPETPAFPVTPRTPYGTNNGYNTLYTQARSSTPQLNGSQVIEVQNYNAETIYQKPQQGYQLQQQQQQQQQQRSRLNSSLSLANSEPQEVAPHLVKFAKDSSKFWYKPNLSREEAISLLLHAAPGTFVVRDSTTYKNAYGLVLRVAQAPPGGASGKPDELVRHFLIEPTTRGVRLKGCANEPVFTSLSALVYEHSINALALPCALRIPEHDLIPPLVEHTPAQKQLLTQGAACNVLWLYSCDTESLTGEEAIRKAIRQFYAQKPLPTPTEVHFKVTQQGITLTDNTRKKFFRKHYVADMISFCAIDPDHRTYSLQQQSSEENANGGGSNVGALKKTIFAFVARRSPSSKDNQCHVFCDMAINQPASAIVSFANKTLPTERQRNYVL